MRAAKTIARKVLVYCARDGALLVFRHRAVSSEEVGIQVPGGTVWPGEGFEQAALRELVEETGFDSFEAGAILGADWYDISPYRAELQERFFVLARPTAPMPERWESEERHDGVGPPTPLECFWIPLRSAHVLQSAQGSMLWRLAAE